MFGISIQVWFVVAGMVLAIILLFSFIAQMFRKAGPNEAFIVYGFRGTRVIKGGGTIVFPMFESFRALSLELMSFDVAPQQNLYTKQGVAVTVEAVAQIKVRSDRESIATAAEQFLTKTPAQREGLIRLVMEGHLRGIIGQLAVEEIVKQPEMVADRMRGTCADDMNKIGLEVVSFTIKEVRDKNDYIANMGRPDIARIKMQADIAAAEAESQRLMIEAEGRAASVRVQGEAEAEIIFKKGEAEAKAMNVKATAYQEWNQAAVVDRLITNMPEMIKAMAAPLANIDKITIVSTGDGAAAGAHKVTGDIAAMAAQVPALFEALSGMKMSELLSRVKMIGATTETAVTKPAA